MGRRVPCPCAPCNEKGTAVVDHGTRRRHMREIEEGKRLLYHVAQPLQQHEDHAPEAVEDVELSKDRLFAIDVLRIVSHNNVSASSGDRFLHAFYNHYGETLQSVGYEPPRSLYMAKKESMMGEDSPEWFSKRFCQACGAAISGKSRNCERCGTDFDERMSPDAVVQAYYADLPDKLSRIFGVRPLRDPLRHGTPHERHSGDRDAIDDRELADVWDGTMMDDLYYEYDGPDKEEKDNFLYFMLCQDGVEVRDKKSYTPVTAKLLNWPPKMRSLLESIILLGFLPPSVKDYTAMLRPIVAAFAKYRPGQEPLELYDAAHATTVRVWLVMAVTVSDIRGMPAVTCGKSPPCKIGGCNACHAMAVAGGRYYPGAVRALSKRSKEGREMRDRFRKEFAHVSELKSYHDENWPKDRTHKDAVAEGGEYARETAAKVWQDNAPNYGRHRNERRTVARKIAEIKGRRDGVAFYAVDALSEALPYWDKIKCSVYDPAHQHANMIKLMMQMITNKGTNGKYYAHRKNSETLARQSFRRFRIMRPDWMTDGKGISRIDALAEFCPVPRAFPPMRKWVQDVIHVKTTEWFLLTGDAGAIVLRTAGVRGAIRDLWIELLRLMERVMRKVSTPGDRDHLKKRLPALMAEIEMQLPLKSNTAVNHIYACQTLTALERWGPFHTLSMLDFERYHTKFKQLARSRNLLMASIRNHYMLKEITDRAVHSTSKEEHAKLLGPMGSTVDGLKAQHASKDKTDRYSRPLGKGTPNELHEDELKALNKIWGGLYGVEGDSDNTSIVEYQRAEYAGNCFQTEGYQTRARRRSRARFLTDNTRIRLDYREHVRARSLAPGTLTRVTTIFGTILRIFEHVHTPDNPPKLVLECRWFKTIGKCSIAGTTLVQEDDDDAWASDTFTFLETAFQLPVAVWPHDERTGGMDRNGKKTYDVVDRNQDEYHESPPGSDNFLPDAPEFTIEDSDGEEAAGPVHRKKKRRKKNGHSAQRRAETSGDDEGRGQEIEEGGEGGSDKGECDGEGDEGESDGEGEGDEGKGEEGGEGGGGCCEGDETSDEDDETCDEGVEDPNDDTGEGRIKHDAICSVCFQRVHGTAHFSCPTCPRVYHHECTDTALSDGTNTPCQNLTFDTQHLNDDLANRLSVCTARKHAL